jgi:signal transduction histidine kinase/AmiR/NasT family two-component response regulator
MFSSIHRSYNAHHEARLEFLTKFQLFAFPFAAVLIASFLLVGSWGSALGTSLFLVGLLLSVHWRKQGRAFLASCWLAVTFLVEPTTAIVLSKGIESPYIVWLIAPIFAAGGLLGANGAILAAISAVITYLALMFFDTAIAPLNELSENYYDFMFFLSFSSAAIFTSVLAWIAISALERDSLAAQASAAESALSAEELRQTETLLRHELNERDKLYAIISHELRTPAATLKMMFDEHVVQHLQSSEKSTINDTLEHMMSVMDDMRLAREPEQMRKSPVKAGLLSDVVTQAIKMARRFTEESSLTVNTSIEGDAEELVALPKQIIRQITINLVKNCAVHAEASRLNITINWTKSSNQMHYCVKFSDDGCGIDKKHIPTLFDAFSRADSEVDGSGLGLNVCKDFAKSMGGDLVYQTSSLGGAEFVLTANLDLAELEEDRPLQTQAENQLKDAKILLVEDSDVLRKLTAKILTKRGADVTEASDGLEALKLFGSTHFDLVITDLHMPNLDGIELARSLRGLHYGRPIIGLTAAFGEESKLLQRAGVDDILIKPLNIERLETALADFKSKSRTTDSLIATEAEEGQNPRQLPSHS